MEEQSGKRSGKNIVLSTGTGTPKSNTLHSKPVAMGADALSRNVIRITMGGGQGLHGLHYIPSREKNIRLQKCYTK